MKTKFKSTPRYTELRIGRVLVTWWKSYRRLSVRLCRRAQTPFGCWTEIRLGRVRVAW
jgi:hypothetical protein